MRTLPAIIAVVAALLWTPARAVETEARHSSGVFMLTMPDGWGWREMPGPFPNGDGASIGGEALFFLVVAPAGSDDLATEARRYLPLVQRRWLEAAVSGAPRGTTVGSATATIYRLVFKEENRLRELRTIIFLHAGNVIMGAMRTDPPLAAKFESSLREILATVKVRPVAPPPQPQPQTPPETAPPPPQPEPVKGTGQPI
ncbi:MAG: hypothetical protein HZA91_16300 [Verrucomicrobia bacterium]|nr:hypothetical protein [Verrucomicrobiota bacterium]